MNSSPDTPSGDLRRLPGFYRRWDLTEVLELHPNCQIEDAGNHADGTPLVAVFSSEPAAPGTDRLVQMPVGELATLPASELFRLQREVDEALRRAKLADAWLDGALSLRYSARAHQARAVDLKDTGTVRFDDNGVTVVADLPKRVKWNQQRLKELVDLIGSQWGENPTDYVKVKFEVSERAYEAWPPKLRELFTPARIVETGRPSYDLIPPGEGRRA